MLVKLEGRDTDNLVSALVREVNTLQAGKMETLTWDRGNEHLPIESVRPGGELLVLGAGHLTVVSGSCVQCDVVSRRHVYVDFGVILALGQPHES